MTHPDLRALVENANGLVNLVRPQLLLGNYVFEQRPLQTLRNFGITHVVQAGTGCFMSCTHIADLPYLSIPADDDERVDLLQLIKESRALQFIQHAIESGGTVLVHCQVGMSRSATIVIAYLMWRDRMPFSEALAEAVAARSMVQPNIGFCEQLVRLEAAGGDIDAYQPLQPTPQVLTQQQMMDRWRWWNSVMAAARKPRRRSKHIGGRKLVDWSAMFRS